MSGADADRGPKSYVQRRTACHKPSVINDTDNGFRSAIPFSRRSLIATSRRRILFLK